MLLVKTYLDRSAIHGIGLFAGERIRKGTVIWRRSPEIDLLLTALGKFVLCGDDARFFNHADAPNCHDIPDEGGGPTVAARDIEAGEELTSDYASFDANHRAP